MKLVLDATLAARRNGIEARLIAIRLSGHGDDHDSAIHSVRRAAQAWANGLAAGGSLEAAARRAGVRLVPDGEGVEVEVNVRD